MKDSRRRPSSRPQFNDRDTHDFSTPSLDVEARPVDPYVEHGKLPVIPEGQGKYAHFHAMMGGLERAMRGGVDAFKHYEATEMEAGQLSAARKEELGDDKSNAFIYGHQFISGKAAGAELAAILDKHFEENKELTPGEFDQSQANIVRQYAAGRSDAFIKGLAPEAIQLEEKYHKAYVAHTKDVMHSDMIGKSVMVFEAETDTMMAEDRMPPEELPKLVRSKLTTMQNDLKQYGIDRNQVSKAVLQKYAEKAIAEGRPELLDFANELDGAGVSLATRPEFAEKVFQARQAAEKVKERNQKELVQAKRQAEDSLLDNTYADLADAIAAGDNQKIKAIGVDIQKMRDPSNPLKIELQLGKYRQLVSAHTRAVGAGNKTGQSNPDALRHYMIQASQGTLDLSDEAGMDVMESQLSSKDQKAVIRKSLTNSESSPAKREYLRMGKQLLRKIAKSDGSIFASDDDAENYYNVAMMLDEEYERALKGQSQFVLNRAGKPDSRPPNRAETMEIHKHIEGSYKGTAPAAAPQGKTSSKTPQTQTQDREALRRRLFNKE